jgi:methionyl aminopeptidase
MAINIYTSKEIAKITASGMLAFETHMLLKDHIRPGVTTAELDELVRAHLSRKKARPSFLGYGGFPGAICTSVNDAVVHGIPSATQVLREGDIIGIDLGVDLEGYYSDTAWTWPVGKVSDEARQLITATQQGLFRGIAEARPDARIGAIGEAVQKHTEGAGFSVVRELVGHGVGKTVHEEPQVPNFGNRKNGIRMRAGMVLAIEPMINSGSYHVYTDRDKWTVRTKDGKLSAHFEHTVALTSAGPLNCTLPKGAETDVFKLMGLTAVGTAK